MEGKNCKKCEFEAAPNKCLRGCNGEKLEYNEVRSEPGHHDEYDCCAYFKKAESI